MKRIALTVSYASHPTDGRDLWRLEKYFAAIQNGGEVEVEALFLNAWSENPQLVIEKFDGVVLAGGADLPTQWYGEAPLQGANLETVSETRPKFENHVVGAFLEAKKPVLGICYGCQFLNVYRGGALIQDIELQLPNRENPVVHVDGNEHTVTLNRDSQLYEIIGETEFAVPSYHHQAVSKVAPDAWLTSFAPDGVAESVEWRGGGFCLGVQWHPERAPESNATRKLMRAFVAAA